MKILPEIEIKQKLAFISKKGFNTAQSRFTEHVNHHFCFARRPNINMEYYCNVEVFVP